MCTSGRGTSDNLLNDLRRLGQLWTFQQYFCLPGPEGVIDKPTRPYIN